MKKNFIYYLLLLGLLAVGCRKTEYANINQPAYLRVFNSLEYMPTMDNKDAPQPFLVMLIDPVMDADGLPVSAAVTGDFLKQRSSWARPYPDAASNVIWQTEYPGTKRVLAAPTLNGYDLSSWAQVPSGKHRVIFQTRPLNNTPYFELSKLEKGIALVDTTIDLTAQEVYTMHVLLKSYAKQDPVMYLRQESFHKQPFADSLVYVNFYNLSADGFFDLAPNTLPNTYMVSTKLRDTMSIYYSLKRRNNSTLTSIPGYDGVPVGKIVRSQDGKIAPYYSFPMFADTSSNRIFTGNMSQMFQFFGPGVNPQNLGYPDFLPIGVYSSLILGDYGPENTTSTMPFMVRADLRTGMIISIHSGRNNPQSFSTVNTVEYINRKFYVTTIQRVYAPPVY